MSAEPIPPEQPPELGLIILEPEFIDETTDPAGDIPHDDPFAELGKELRKRDDVDRDRLHTHREAVAASVTPAERLRTLKAAAQMFLQYLEANREHLVNSLGPTFETYPDDSAGDYREDEERRADGMKMLSGKLGELILALAQLEVEIIDSPEVLERKIFLRTAQIEGIMSKILLHLGIEAGDFESEGGDEPAIFHPQASLLVNFSKMILVHMSNCRRAELRTKERQEVSEKLASYMSLLRGADADFKSMLSRIPGGAEHKSIGRMRHEEVLVLLNDLATIAFFVQDLSHKQFRDVVALHLDPEMIDKLYAQLRVLMNYKNAGLVSMPGLVITLKEARNIIDTIVTDYHDLVRRLEYLPAPQKIKLESLFEEEQDESAARIFGDPEPGEGTRAVN